MFKKVLIADDLGSINQGVVTVLDTIGIKKVEQVQYCDDAVLRIKRAIIDKEPFDLVITDLSFKSDHREQKLDSGEALVKYLKKNFPELKVIVYSVEERLQRVRTLVQTNKADAYVCKGRRGLIEINQAISKVYKNELFVSVQVSQALSDKTNLDINDYDIELVKQLSHGLDQKGVSAYFKTNNISPSSVSSIEKRLNKLRIQFKADNATHLVAKMKDSGLI